MKECPQDLIDAHWEYVKQVMFNAGEVESRIALSEFHYKTAFAHGWKHAKEDEEFALDPVGD